MDITADGLEVVVADRFADQRGVGSAAVFVVLTEGEEAEMRRNEGIVFAFGVACVARPWILTRRFDYRGTDRIHLDVAVAGEQIAFAVYQAGLESTLP